MTRQAEPAKPIDQETAPRVTRWATLILVLTLHAALIAALLATPGTGVLSDAAEAPVQITMLPRAAVPKVRSESPHPRQWNAPVALDVTPPMLQSLDSSSIASSAESSVGRGTGIDWAAEARRALQAFEIRSHPAESYGSVSQDPAEDNWWPRGQHHAGDKFKTPNGDWIVWVDSNCYRVANADSIGYAQGAALSSVICRDPSARDAAAKP